MNRKILGSVLCVGTFLSLSMTSLADNTFEFSQLPETLIFSSGVGAWATEISVSDDGSFIGTYHDHDYDPEYEEGVMYYCEFEGKFTEPEDMGDGVFCCKVESLVSERAEGDIEVRDGMRIEYSAPWGMNDAENILIYTPGTLESFIADDAKNAPLYSYQDINGVIPEGLYLVYNENADALFFGKEEYESAPLEKNESEYIINGISERYITAHEVERLSLQAVNYAKNEIYAIHGRKFKSTELNDYFNSRSWYEGIISGEDFSDTVFNEYEKANLKLLVDREIELAGTNGYILDQPGYDIFAVRGEAAENMQESGEEKAVG